MREWILKIPEKEVGARAKSLRLTQALSALGNKNGQVLRPKRE